MMAQPGCLVLSYLHDDTTGLPAHTHAAALAQQLEALYSNCSSHKQTFECANPDHN